MNTLSNVITFTLFSSVCVAQPATFHVSSLKDPSIQTVLFDAKKIESGFAIWEPNFSEAGEFNVSEDGMCHTKIDTVFEFTSYGKREALILFTTYGIGQEEGYFDCHVCAPDVSVAVFAFDSAVNRWSFVNMNKYLTRHGSWGTMGDRALRRIGKDLYALELASGYSGQGYTSAGMSLYELQGFAKIFSIATHADNEGVGDDQGPIYSWDRAISFAKPKIHYAGYDDIIVTTKGRGHRDEEDDSSPIVNLSGKERYHYDDTAGQYIKGK